MAATGLRRVALGTLAGWIVWGIWSTIMNMVILKSKYQIAQEHQLDADPTTLPALPALLVRDVVPPDLYS